MEGPMLATIILMVAMGLGTFLYAKMKQGK